MPFRLKCVLGGTVILQLKQIRYKLEREGRVKAPSGPSLHLPLARTTVMSVSCQENPRPFVPRTFPPSRHPPSLTAKSDVASNPNPDHNSGTRQFWYVADVRGAFELAVNVRR